LAAAVIHSQFKVLHQLQLTTVGNLVLQIYQRQEASHLSHMVEMVAPVETEVLVVVVVAQHQVAVVALAEQEIQQQVELVLTRISLAQLLCMAVVALDQMAVQDPRLPVEEATAILQQQTEAGVDHSQRRIVDLDLQVQLVL
jgi:hypothetical protein